MRCVRWSQDAGVGSQGRFRSGSLGVEKAPTLLAGATKTDLGAQGGCRSRWVRVFRAEVIAVYFASCSLRWAITKHTSVQLYFPLSFCCENFNGPDQNDYSMVWAVSNFWIFREAQNIYLSRKMHHDVLSYQTLLSLQRYAMQSDLARLSINHRGC